MRCFNHLRLSAIAGAATLLVAGCGNYIENGVEDADLIPLGYPKSSMTVCALGWGDPEGNLEAFRPANQNVSEDLFKNVPTSDAAWFNKSHESNKYFSVVASPGPEVLDELKVLPDAEGAMSLAKSSSEFVDWGELTEQSIDYDRLSSAIVRGWYNLPGESFRYDALAVYRPDKITYENRPWIVQRSVSAKGLTYGISDKLAVDLKAAATQPMYASGKAKLGFDVTDEKTMRINKPCALGVDVADLVSIDPPLPAAGLQLAPGSAPALHKFTWRKRESGDERVVEVDPAILREQARRNGLDSVIPKAVVEEVKAKVNAAEPAKLSVIAEAKMRTSPADKPAQWRRVGENDTFTSDELVRIKVMLDEPAYVYVLAKDSSGKAAVLYPTVAGQPLSRGMEAAAGKGTWTFPTDVKGIEGEGMTFDNGPKGLESFVVFASKTKVDGLPQALATYATAASDKSTSGSATRGFGFDEFTRIPTGYANAATTATPSKADQGEPIISGVGCATVFTLNLVRMPAS